MSESKRFTRGRAALAVLFASGIAVPATAIAAPPGGGGSTPTPNVVVANDDTQPVPVAAPGGGPLPVSLGDQPVPVDVGDQPLSVTLGNQPVPVTSPVVNAPEP